MSNIQFILDQLPYSEPFLFVDALETVNEDGVTGSYTFREDSYFYAGHFKDNPVTPGVILTECMAQIGLVCFGIYLLSDQITEGVNIALSNSNVDYLLPVFPNEKITVISEIEYFRFNKLKCKVKMINSENKVVCKGVISGMIAF